MPSSSSDRPSLRIASYNLRGLRDDARLAARIVRTIAPDVLLLQEVPRYPASSYAITAFARESGMLWSGRTRMVSGTSIMTGLRVMPGDAQDRRLRVGLRENPRSYTVTTVALPGQTPVTAVSVHLPLKDGQRVEHVGTVLRELTDDLGLPADAPLVIGGDINEEAGGSAWGLLSGALPEVSDGRATFPAAAPHRRIDAIFARGHRSVEAARPELLEALEGLDLAAASDHLPIWVDLSF